MLHSPVFCLFLTLPSKLSSHPPVLRHPQPGFSRKVRDLDVLMKAITFPCILHSYYFYKHVPDKKNGIIPETGTSE
jgi:hypothetical protein